MVGSPRKEFKLHTESKAFAKEINTQGTSQTFSIQFPYDNEYLEMFTQRKMGPQIIQILQRVFNDNYRVDKYFKAQGFG